ncbi:hypothetical protein F5Y00DRAFT_115918 [Daldinia vernicosa]|uniref:uncharacterized protein n=1 Tax=Daldinia vernicosa TaxID=114800 RepID=UPI002008C090|nr:uncharacterized protein F5Y00DRAFT_115918 [Daldinia vernicosa]KAI0847548.1 hypothetical protein F5Y00DRAFT_115918 [Daldinia vernicosa]
MTITTPTYTAGFTAVTSLGPLTTTFVPPESCFPPIPSTDTEDGTSFYKVGTVSADDGCLPPDWVVNGYYSPGVCPYGYSAVCEAAGDNVETTVCCPYYRPNLFQCSPTIKFGSYGCGFYTNDGTDKPSILLAPSILIVNAAGDIEGSLTGTSSSGSVTSNEVIPTGSTNTINSNLFTSNTADPSRTLGAGPSSSDISAVDTSAQPDSDSSSSGLRVLGGGAIAGIVVGVVGALMLGAAGTFFYMRRRSAGSPSPPPSSPSPPTLPPRNPELLVHELHDKSRPPEMPESNVLYELHQPHSQSEMPTWNERNPQGPNRPMAWELPG